MMRGDYSITEYTEHLRKKIISDITSLDELKRKGKRGTMEYNELEVKLHLSSIALKRRYELQKER